MAHGDGAKGDATEAIAESFLNGEEMCNVATAAWLLEFYGSDQDPIVYRGDSTTPNSLSYSEVSDADARKVRITYFGTDKEGKLKRVKGGTLIGMLRDRMKDRRTPKPKKREHCRTCVCFV